MGWKLNEIEGKLFDMYGNENCWADFASNGWNLIGLSYLIKLKLLYQYKNEINQRDISKDEKMDNTIKIDIEIENTKEDLFGDFDMHRYFMKEVKISKGFYDNNSKIVKELVIPYKYIDDGKMGKVKCIYYWIDKYNPNNISIGFHNWINLRDLFNDYEDITPYCMGLGRMNFNEEDGKRIYKTYLRHIEYNLNGKGIIGFSCDECEFYEPNEELVDTVLDIDYDSFTEVKED